MEKNIINGGELKNKRRKRWGCFLLFRWSGRFDAADSSSCRLGNCLMRSTAMSTPKRVAD